ncbi:electron transfer flavoprotein-ubiquinone oxidoreductase [Deefgea piscis]|uniref:Electron transfer flavoprotein-ubiquinone oxidoreductase n=1 Tax=Deefgea piscis TaxID=2739061 RepID=A0A6M8SKA7_9NEIS|nr:electron transfer flavoprotein-ubiquinone oxidoreductase [Deefgea piscis]QKJ65525.1 electron transfer flavoprotein-ubiquinone oxidoreductase [Deefgea piscis]
MQERDVMEYDVLIIGAGPAGLSSAIAIKQLNPEISVCILEKGAQVGAHILSGAVIDPVALNQLIPDWQHRAPQLATAVSQDEFFLLDEDTGIKIPQILLPPQLHNDGCFIVKLGEVCAWLASEAENLGVEIYPGFAAAEVLYDDAGAVMGVAVGDMGINKLGQHKADYALGMAIHAKYTLFCEGARGSLAGDLENKFALRKDADPQHFGLGVKEVWQVKPEHHHLGLVQHAQGWPLDNSTSGGAFIYHLPEHQVAIGYVVHLNYQNPTLSPFEELQRFKTHPKIRGTFAGAKRIAYGARAIAEGGLQSLPKMTFPGGILLGCSAGLLNFPRIKGTHNAMLSGMLAAPAIVEAIANDRQRDELIAFNTAFAQSSIWQELQQVRNIKPAISKLGTLAGTMYAGAELWLSKLGINTPWTLRHSTPDNTTLKRLNSVAAIHYPKPDGVLTFNKLDSLMLANVSHDHDQPSHLQLRDTLIPITVNLAQYGSPESHYCPAGVYEIIQHHDAPALQINAQNCLHCKTCDIKDPQQNIHWVPPEGGGGPLYGAM